MSDKLDSLPACGLGVGISSDGKYVVLMLTTPRGTDHHYMDRNRALAIADLITRAAANVEYLPETKEWKNEQARLEGRRGGGVV